MNLTSSGAGAVGAVAPSCLFLVMERPYLSSEPSSLKSTPTPILLSSLPFPALLCGGSCRDGGAVLRDTNPRVNDAAPAGATVESARRPGSPAGADVLEEGTSPLTPLEPYPEALASGLAFLLPAPPLVPVSPQVLLSSPGQLV